MQKNVTICYIEKNHPSSQNGGTMMNTRRKRVFPYIMRTYPARSERNVYLKRRDFECRSVQEAIKIANAVYKNPNIVY